MRSVIVLSGTLVAAYLIERRRWVGHAPIIVTLADGVSFVMTAGVERLVQAFHADRVVDQTGAGDAFAAGLAIALAEARPLLDAVRFAHAVASFAVEGIGTEGLADRERVEARIARG